MNIVSEEVQMVNSSDIATKAAELSPLVNTSLADISTENAYVTPLTNATLLPMLLLSLARMKYSPKTASSIKTEYDYVIGPLASAELASALTFLKKDEVNPKKDFPNFELAFGEGDNVVFLQLGFTPETFLKVYAPYEGRSFYICVAHLLQPKSRGTVTLRSRDPYDSPVIDPNYYEDPEDIEDVVDGLKACNLIGNSDPMKQVGSTPFKTLVPGCEKYKDDEDEYLRCQVKSMVFTLSHPVGTAKMGDLQDTRTVVDPQLRVKNIGALRVVDASVMPIIPSGNTNAPTIMVAEKASDIIKSTIRCCCNKTPEKERPILLHVKPLVLQETLEISTAVKDLLST